jgi:phage terminase large subunit
VEIQLPEAFAELFEPSRYKAYFGGRGSAKSHSFGRALLAKGRAKQLRIGCFREVQTSIKASVKQLLDDCIAETGQGGFYESIENAIRGRNGTTFLFSGLKSLTAENIKSLEGLDIAWVEEASTVSQTSIDILRPTIRKPGSEIWFSWNPRLPTDPVDVMFRGGEPPPGSIIREVNYDRNPWFPAELQVEMEWDRRRDPDKFKHIWLGQYRTQSAATVFRNWVEEEFETPTDAVHRFGADWGFSVDPTVLVRCHIIGRKLYVDQEAYAVGCEIDNTPALFDRLDGSRKWTIRADSARPETVSYMQRKGFRIVPAIKGPGSLEDGIEFLKSYDIVVHPRCKHTIAELALYSYKTDPLTDEVLPVLEDKNNHVIDALRYACEGLRRAPKPSSEKPSPNPPDLWGRPKVSANGWKTA